MHRLSYSSSIYGLAALQWIVIGTSLEFVQTIVKINVSICRYVVSTPLTDVVHVIVNVQLMAALEFQSG